uniref:Uncharacterized protein n=1 Tax=Oryza alta TaxID=52545 RepID=A0A1V1H3N0_9ORYZ|nr:hypothetical protein [Oryza alta]
MAPAALPTKASLAAAVERTASAWQRGRQRHARRCLSGEQLLACIDDHAWPSPSRTAKIACDLFSLAGELVLFTTTNLQLPMSPSQLIKPGPMEIGGAN